MEMGVGFADAVQLVSFHSTSKGFIGECGIRGGYFELHNFDEDVKTQLYKLASLSLCANLPGQIAVGLMVNPPVNASRGSPAAQLHISHKEEIMSSLERRANKLHAVLNELHGISVQPINASLYAFPRIHLPKAALEVAKVKGQSPDLFYCLALLRETGIITVPGSGFKQREGEMHFRITILPPEDKMDAVISRFTTFHTAFMDQYSHGEL